MLLTPGVVLGFAVIAAMLAASGYAIYRVVLADREGPALKAMVIGAVVLAAVVVTVVMFYVVPAWWD